MKLDSKKMLLYAVTKSAEHDENLLYSQVEAALKGGITLLQLREKELGFDEFLKEALQIKKLCQKYGVPLIINDNVEVAKRADADGVHIGQGDADIFYARKILGEEKIIGVSAHNADEALEAEKNGADYLGAGAVFATSTKSDVTSLALSELKNICRSVKIPVVAIGGITAENILKLEGSGAAGVAVVSAIFSQEDISSAARELKALAEKIIK